MRLQRRVRIGKLRQSRFTLYTNPYPRSPDVYLYLFGFLISLSVNHLIFWNLLARVMNNRGCSDTVET